jgi:very-short-patch-repair endonuclease
MMTDHPMNEVETIFYETAIKSLPGLVPQFWIGKYRVDFCLPDKMIVIEIDGKKYHDLHQRLYHDRPRQRDIEHLGYTVVRFKASEVYQDARNCVKRAKRWVWLKQNGLHIERIFPTL